MCKRSKKMTDELDKIVRQQEQELALRLAPHLDAKLSDDEIEKIALQGRDCSDCGLPIGSARLRANPFAYRCIHCQQEYEEGIR